MRKTTLNRTAAVLVAVFAAVAIGFAVLRNTALEDRSIPPDQGAALFREKGCTQCHFTQSRKTKIGPGLKGLFDRERLPVSDRPATEAHVRSQLKDPFEDMPSFADRLTEEQRDRIIDYLKTL
jgi:cytochrome c2